MTERPKTAPLRGDEDAAARSATRWAQVPLVLLSLDLTGLELRVLIALLGHADPRRPGKRVWPSRRRLALLCGMKPGPSGEREVSRALQGLEAKGLLVREHRPGRRMRISLAPFWEVCESRTSPGEIPHVPPGGFAQDSWGNSPGPQKTEEENIEGQHTSGGPAASAAFAAVLSRIVGEGVEQRVAADLLKRHGVEAVEKQLDWLPYRDARKPAAYLVAAVREGWAPPAAVAAREEEERQRAEERGARAAERAASRDTIRRMRGELIEGSEH
jgi:DNA-binding MarR family transcriptional regulator